MWLSEMPSFDKRKAKKHGDYAWAARPATFVPSPLAVGGIEHSIPGKKRIPRWATLMLK